MRAVCIAVIAGVLVAAGPAVTQTTEARLFRVAALNDVGTLSIDVNGQITWGNHSHGEAVRIEAVYDTTRSNEWKTFTDVFSNSGAGAARVFARRTPPGFSFIPAGRFVMGSPTNELGRVFYEYLHEVTLTRGFFIQKTEVTTQQMADVMNWARSTGRVSVTSSSIWNLEGVPQELVAFGRSRSWMSWDGTQLVADAGKEDCPCGRVTWYGALAYCNYLSDMEGLDRAVDFATWGWRIDKEGYRLPTEAEWEYACRAGTTTAFCTGEIIYPEYAWEQPPDPNLDRAGWYAENSERDDGNRRISSPVGLKEPNAWGLFDMHGNVGEWCGDCASVYDGGPETDPTGPPSHKYRISRGGAFENAAKDCRSAVRYSHRYPIQADSALGFRPARTAVQ